MIISFAVTGPGYLTRVTLTGAMSGRSSPSSVRSVDCQVNVSLFTGVRMFVAVSSPPSAWTPVAAMTQRLPSRVQVPSPKPP
jgi:hypothetical protein